ncbi:protein translocase subunit SecF [Desulfuribacillus alkaliarsenatis]|uniref:protein translocase subunit SecF n=1 Tax=Desulfuribacillus alkaliarsenatis TaxID=766136 RepID=UPI000A017F05|nr:protein translocase subunit SecF [Desulfuribacillus alkaliarsenatis]
MRWEWNYDLVSHRKKYFIVALVIVLIGFASLMIQGLNLGVDFVSGSRIAAYLGESFDSQEIYDIYNQLGLEPSVVRAAGEANDIAIARFDTTVDHAMLPEIRAAFNERFPNFYDIEESSVSPQVGEELAQKAIYSVIIASLFIILYVSFRFEYRFAVAGILALLHDAFFVITLFSILQLEVNLPFIAAVLTIIGYSINDTIVVFDRIRENMKFAKIKSESDLEKVANDSLMQTMTRSINTVLTVLFGAVALVIFGGESLREFSLALTFGLVAGAYSSIFLAAQVWLAWKVRDFRAMKAKQAS